MGITLFFLGPKLTVLYLSMVKYDKMQVLTRFTRTSGEPKRKRDKVTRNRLQRKMDITQVYEDTRLLMRNTKE